MSADPAVFLGRVDDEGKVHLDFPAQQRAYCKAKLAGKCIDVIVCEQGALKTRLQEQGFHAMITPWARQEGHAIEDLKRDLLLAIFGTREYVNVLTGDVSLVLREPHTSQLSRTKYAELIERTLEIAAENGVILMAPHEYRKAHERRKQSKATATKPEAA